MRNSCTYKISGTKTFRLSSSKILGKWGGNLQNVEKSLRRIYVPDPGKIFVQVDQSGAEALIVAYCCRPGNYRNLFINGIKPHSYISMHLFKNVWPRKMREFGMGGEDFYIEELLETPIPELKLNPYWGQLDKLIKSSDNWALTERYYYLGKQTEHSSNYDIKAPTFRMNILEKSGGKIVITQEDAEYFLNVKHSLYPEIKEDFHANIRKQAEQTRMLFNLHGHPYTITTYEIQEADWKELYAIVPQSTVGEITNIAYCTLQNFIEEHRLPWDLLANTHDSYLCQCPIGEERECGRIMQQFIDQELTSPYDGTKFAMRSEAQCGGNWSPYHKDKNPNGLREICY